MNVLRTAIQLGHRHQKRGLVYFLVVIVALLQPAYSQQMPPDGMSKVQWQAVQDFWQYQARRVLVTTVAGDTTDGLLLLADSTRLWVLPNTYWPLQSGANENVVMLRPEDIATLELRKVPRLWRAAYMGALRTFAWSTAYILSIGDDSGLGLGFLVTAGVFTPIGALLNTGYHALVTLPKKEFAPQGSVGAYRREVLPELAKYSLLADPEPYMATAMEGLLSNPESWPELYPAVPKLERLFAPNRYSLAIGSQRSLNTEAMNEQVAQHFGRVSGGQIQNLDYRARGGFGVAATYRFTPRFDVELKGMINNEYNARYEEQVGTEYLYLNMQVRTHEVAPLVGYYLIPPDPFFRHPVSVKAQVGAGLTITDITFGELVENAPGYSARLTSASYYGGLEVQARLHRWLYASVGAHSRITSARAYPAYQATEPVTGVLLDFPETPLPFHALVLTARVQLTLQQRGGW